MLSMRLSGKSFARFPAVACGALAGLAVCLGACGGGSDTSTSDAGTRPTSTGDGGVANTGNGACGSAPTGTCSNSSQLFCGNGNCCDTTHPFYCTSSGLCYDTAAKAAAVCGASCAACTASTGGGGGGGGGGSDAGGGGGGGGGGSDAGTGGGGSCTTAQPGQCTGADEVSCGPSACCKSQFPYFCASTQFCYAKQSDANAACGASCAACVTPSGGGGGGGGGNDGGTTGGSCTTAQPGQCTNAGEVSCGPNACCKSQFPYFCASTQFCYAKQSDANAACGASCAACVTPSGGGGGGGGGGSCTPAPAGSCNGGDVFCATGACCKPQFPYFCASTQFCYAKQSDAAAACGTSCAACHP